MGFLSILSLPNSLREDMLGQQLQSNKLEDKLRQRNDKRSTLTNSEGAERLAQEIEQHQLARSPPNYPVMMKAATPPGGASASGLLKGSDSGDESGGDARGRKSLIEEVWPAEEAAFIAACVERLFSGKTLREEDLQQLAVLFAQKWGRRCFSR